MRKLVKLISTNEIEKFRKEYYVNLVQEIDQLFIGLTVDEITLKCNDDEKGQLTDVHITFKPNDSIIPQEPWLRRSKDKSKVELSSGFYNF